MVVALFAALIVPWFVNWNDYRASFEAEASRILGHRVHVEGDAHAIILPSPSLTFTQVEVDDQDGKRLMDVGRFDVVIELMPLLQGEIRVVSMSLEKPVVNVAVDAVGNLAWLSRAKLREPFDPDKVVLDIIAIEDGTLNYADARSGVALSFGGIRANVTARALSGPWHVDGSYLDGGQKVQFNISTGRALDDGTLRVKANVIPARLPLSIDVDGPVGIDPDRGLTWSGTYSLAQVATDGGGEANDGGDAAGGAAGWRSEGAFTLTGDRLEIAKAVLSNGPVDRPLSVAGALTLSFGKAPSFAATAEARQIDLDRTLGKGPSQPVDVAAATDSLVAWLSQLPVPDIPGSISLDVPTIVVGGRIIEDVAFTAAPAKGGWQIGSLSARLPGQATLKANGLMTTRQKFGFVGGAHLAVAQPATFATWWRGDSHEGAGRLLAPFDLSGRADIGPGRIEIDDVTARIDDATITGSFGWAEGAKDKRRDLFADLDATRIDFVQLKALGELLVGRNLTNAGSLADGYSLHVKADAFVFQDLTVKGIEVNAKYRDDALTVTALKIADIGGARIEETSGKIDHLSDEPRGHLDATLDAPTLTGLARLAGQFLPQSGFTRWLDAAAPSLGEAVMTARVTAPLPSGGPGFAFTIDNGTAASTTVEKLSAAFTGGFAHWRTKPAEIAVQLYSPDSAELARQFGLAAVTLAKDDSASLNLSAKGVPATGLDTVVMVNLAGLNATARGSLTIGEDLAAAFKGTVDADTDNVEPIVAMAGLDIAGSAGGTPLWLDKAALSVSGEGVGLTWKNGKIGPAVAGGDVALAPDGAGGWHIGGSLTADEVDLDWIASLGLGFAPLPTGDPAEPWSREPFAAPAYGQVNGKLTVAADRLDVGDLGVTGTRFTLALEPQRIDVDLTAGQLDGGTVTGGMSVHNVGGNANFSGRFDLKGAALESFVWRREGRSVATGTLDLSANFESTGRSPAGLTSTMTGGGVLTVHDGLARYVNPGAARQIVRSSDLGQQFSEDALKAAFSERIDADNLAFKEASGAFAIVAGAVRLKNLIVKTEGLSAKGNAVVDFNTMTLDSDWSLAFDPVDNKVQGVTPEAGLVFHGPIADPSRSIDVLQFAAYLNEREAARMTEIIALDAATRAEKERLARLADKLKQDAAQRAEDARIAAEREAARRAAAQAEAAILEAFHVNREILIEERHVATLTAFAARLAAEQKQAEAAAAEAVQAAKVARAQADMAATTLADARQADAAAAAKAEAAAADFARAQANADTAAADASQSAAAADTAKRALDQASAAETKARAAADRAVQAKADAEDALKVAAARAAEAESTANTAKARVASTTEDRDAADKAAAAAIAARDAARTDLAKAEEAVKAGQAVADVAAMNATTLGGGESAAQAAKAAADAEAQAAADALAAATTVRNDAAATLDKAKQDASAAQDSSATATADAEQAAKIAQRMTAAAGTDEIAIARAQAMQSGADNAAQDAAEKKAIADAAARALAEAQVAFDQAAGAWTDAQKRSDAATTAVARADAAVRAAAADANRAASNKDAAEAGLAKAVKARDAAQAALTAKDAAVEKTAAAARAAARAAADAAAASDRAAAALRTALADKAAAADTLAQRAGAADAAEKAAEAAARTRVTAAADAEVATTQAAAAADASAQAGQTLAAKTAAHAAAATDAGAAAGARQAAETAAKETEAQAETAEAAANTAASRATEAAVAASAAERTAEQAAQTMTSTGRIEIPAPSQPKPDSAMAPGDATVAPEPAALKPVPAPRPKTGLPLPLLPSVIPTDGPLVITPPKY